MGIKGKGLLDTEALHYHKACSVRIRKTLISVPSDDFPRLFFIFRGDSLYGPDLAQEPVPGYFWSEA